VRATYEVQNLPWGLEQLTLSALRNVIGQLDLDHTLSSRDSTNTQLRAALDSATQQWGVKVMRIELKNITPPEEIRLTMEKQMTAERTRRAVVTTAEGEKSSAILRAEGQKQAAIVNAEGSKEAAILAAEGQAQARLRVAQAEAQAIHEEDRATCRAIGRHGAHLIDEGSSRVRMYKSPEAMRVKPPAQGKTVWLENITFLWRRLSFGWRMVFRNLIRNRLRTAVCLFAAAMGAEHGRAAVYVFRNYTCRLPVFEPAQLVELIQ
jgi:ribosomal protein L23